MNKTFLVHIYVELNMKRIYHPRLVCYHFLVTFHKVGIISMLICDLLLGKAFLQTTSGKGSQVIMLVCMYACICYLSRASEALFT